MRPKRMPRISSREWSRKFSSQIELEQVCRENQRGSNRRSAVGLLARGPRRVGKSLKRNIVRSLPFPLDPPGNEPDVTQNGKGRQCVSARFAGRATFVNIFGRERILAGEKIRKCNNALALALSCGRLAAFTGPLSDSRDVRAAAVGRAENWYSGGRATWASLFSSSSG